MKCRSSSLLFETRTFGTAVDSVTRSRQVRTAREDHDQRDQRDDRTADRRDAAHQRPAIVGLALGGELLDLGRARRDRAAQAIDPLVELGELRVLDAVEVDERAERDEPALDLALGLRDLARLALLLGVELGEPVRVALARVVEAALRGVELGLRGVELRGRLADRPLERRRAGDRCPGARARARRLPCGAARRCGAAPGACSPIARCAGLTIVVLGGLEVRLLAALELLALVAQAAALALEVRELALRLVDQALGLGQLRVALALDVDELRVLLGLAAVDLAVLLAERADPLLGAR